MNAIFVRDLSGNEYACQATITNNYELNGNHVLSATILPSKVNRLFIDDIAEMWEITDFDDVTHKIVYAKKKGEGRLLSVEIKAIPLFFDTFDTERIYDEYNEHMTAMRCFTLIFEDSGYNFVLVDSFDAIEWEGLGGGETRLEMFKRALNRYGAEFRISGNTIYLHKQVGRDTQFQYRHRLNASNIVLENDATAMWTYAKGYGDFEEGDEEGGGGWENANLIREYTSPLANIPQIGIRHAPPIKDGRISDKTTMDKALKELVDESLKISVTADIHDLRRQGYPLAQPELGDRVFLIDERIGLDEEVRVVDISITRNWRGEVIDLNLTFGSEGITKRYQSNLSTAIKNITEVMAGRKKIPYSVLDNAVLQATKALQNAQTELKFTEQGILAIDKNNPNLVTILNSAGVGVSTDGGATFGQAITGYGINASYIVTGVLDAGQVVVRGGDSSRYTLIQNDEFEARGIYTRTWFNETTTHDVAFRIKDGHMRVENFTENKRLYYSDTGIATFIRGYDDESTDAETHGSGVIEFFSHMYDPNVRGLTLFSNRGTIGLRTETRDIVLDAKRYLIVKNDNLYTDRIHTKSNATNFYVGVSGENDGELRVTNKLFWQGSHENTRYMNVRANGLHGRFLVAPSGDYFAYIGSDLGVRVTSRGVYNNDPIIFRPIQAADFQERSSRKFKTDISKYEKHALDIINDLNVVRYKLKEDGSNHIGFIAEESCEVTSDCGQFISYSSLLANLTKAVQELSNEVEELKNERTA